MNWFQRHWITVLKLIGIVGTLLGLVMLLRAIPQDELSKWASVVQIMSLIALAPIVWTVLKYKKLLEDQRKAKHFQAWQIVNLAYGKPGDNGRIDALQDLNKDGVSLAGLELSGIESKGAWLPGVQLGGANLYQSNLNNCILDGANLRGANLRGATLVGAHLNDVCLCEADLGGADLTDVIMTGACLCKARCIGTIFQNGQLQMSDMREACLKGADLMGANLHEANLSNAILERANMCRAQLQRADLEFARLTSADLTGANLTDARLGSADCGEAQFKDSYLIGTDFTKARWITREQISSAANSREAELPEHLID